MNFKLGEINTLEVKHKSDIGYTLKNKFDNEVFLPFDQTTRELEIGEIIDVFILLDSKKRLVASYNTPVIKVDSPGFVKVTNVVKGLGIFIDNNVLKDPLISCDDLPLDNELWPAVVITSYSIHYTKLYEMGRIHPCLIHWQCELLVFLIIPAKIILLT